MRRIVLAMSLAAALVITAGGLPALPASAVTGEASASSTTEEYLFTVQAAGGSTKQMRPLGPENERFRLILTDVDPVTMFSDRPFRDARLMSPKALDANWEAWFGADPPNAVLTYARPGRAPGSMVVVLTNPSYTAASRTLAFTATRLPREHDPIEKSVTWQRLTTPSSMHSVSLFIDNMTQDRPKAYND
jgi:hypothetical protein